MRLEMKSTQLGGIANLALLAHVKPGFVEGAESFTHVQRLEALFKTLNAIRLASRESTLSKSPFPDALGRLGILHAFRYALIPPEIGDRAGTADEADALDPGTTRLYLSVTFDGGWEPYIRVIYRDLGPMLDTIFTNCLGYPLTRECSFDTYTRWVRSREIPGGIFYAESPKSVLDQRYLEEVERIQREEGDPDLARKRIAALASRPVPRPEQALADLEAADAATQKETVENNFRALKALYDLRSYYANDADARTLLLFAKTALPEFCALLRLKQQDFAAGGRFVPYTPLRDWIEADPGPGPEGRATRAPAGLDPADVQTGVLSAYGDMTHGALFLLALVDLDKARPFLRTLPLSTQGRPHPDAKAIHWNVAFTRRGLEALQAPGECLELLPQEFVEGMEARAGMLGDVRGNHPDHWRRPLYQGREVDLASVHVVLQCRLADGENRDGALHRALSAVETRLASGADGLLLLCTEPMRSAPTGDGRSIEHFGFKDGFSQPVARVGSAAPGSRWDDTVALGELLLGHANDRADGPFPPAPNRYLDNGSFLVVRKIRQHVDRWNAMLRRAAAGLDATFEQRPPAEQQAAADALAAKLVGRDKTGRPAADPAVGPGNDFNYDADPTGSRCPFHAHIRRANPRTAPTPGHRTPRLVRRGMSYGPPVEVDPEAERGLFFMAYCGSIAEQFEVVQRWIAGGNSTGTLSAHSDAMLGVPQKGLGRRLNWLREDGEVTSVDLGELPLTELQWGLYLFVPSRTGLLALTEPSHGHGSRQQDGPTRWGEAYDPGSAMFEQRKAFLQDKDKRDRIWQRVADAGGDVQTAYGRLVSDPAKTLAILQDGGSGYSVCGYGRRFAETIGMGFLGLDPAAGHTRLAEASGIKKHISAIGEAQAFDAARRVTEQLLATRAPGIPGSGQETPVDILELHELVLAGLCTEWFGLPDGRFMLAGTSAEAIRDPRQDRPCCPRDFVHVARHIFGAHPTPLERQRGRDRGQAIHQGVKAYLLDRGGALVGLTRMISQALDKEGLDVIAQTVAGVMLGFAPSVHGNFTNVMRAWVEHNAPDTPSLWDLQLRLMGLPARERSSYAGAEQVLRPALVRQMRRALVPPAVWREAPGAQDGAACGRDGTGGSPASEPPKIVIGLHGLMHNEAVPEIMMFGGAAQGSPSHPQLQTPHACPGNGIAIGVLLGAISTLLLAGTLRATPSFTILKIVR